MLSAYQEDDRVIIDLHGRRRDLLLSPSDAELFADTLERLALLADKVPISVLRGEQWGATVKSFDRKVCVRFYSPDVGLPNRVPLPVGAARALAAEVRSKIVEASYGLSIQLIHKGK